MAKCTLEKGNPENKDVNEEEAEVDKYELFVVPWTNAAQFKKVYDCLFSPEVVKKRWALDQITVWETRCHPSLPAAIEASYGLTSAIVQDILWTNGASINQQLDIQYIYASAITRFVNLTVELHEQFGTMSNLAKSLGIPSFVIDLRNEASHSLRPSLPCLRLAAEAAMKFLKEWYWDVEYSKVLNYTQKSIDVTDFRNALEMFLLNRSKVMDEEKELRKDKEENEKISVSEELFLEIRKSLTEIDSCLRKDKRLLIKVLVSDGIFIPDDEVFKKFVSIDEYSEFQNEEDPLTYLTKFDEGIIPKLPDLHGDFWFDVLVLLNKHDAVPMFLEALLKTQSSRTVIGQKLLLSWVISILRVHTVGACFEKSSIRKLFKRKGIVVDWYSMFYAAIANPCKYTAFIFPLIFCNLDMNRRMTQRVLNLVAIFLGQAVDGSFNFCSNTQVYTVEDVKKMKKAQKEERERRLGHTAKSAWKLVTDDAYKSWPIGHIINPIQVEPEGNLEMDVIDKLAAQDDFVEKFIRINNENDDVSMDSDSSDFEDPHVSETDALHEMSNRKSFLYTN